MDAHPVHHAIDRFARFWIPVVYLLLFTIICNLKLEDYYALSGDHSAIDAEGYEVFIGNQSVTEASYPMTDWWGSIQSLTVKNDASSMWMYALIGVSVLAWFWNKYQQHEHEKKILVMNKVQSRTVEEFHQAQEKRRSGTMMPPSSLMMSMNMTTTHQKARNRSKTYANRLWKNPMITTVHGMKKKTKKRQNHRNSTSR